MPDCSCTKIYFVAKDKLSTERFSEVQTACVDIGIERIMEVGWKGSRADKKQENDAGIFD